MIIINGTINNNNSYFFVVVVFFMLGSYVSITMYPDLEFNFDETKAAMDNFSEEDFNELRQWSQTLDKSKFVPKDLTNKQLVLFYHACYGDLEETKRRIENYYSCRKNSPEFFDQRVMSVEELKSSIEAFEFCVLPGKSCEGYDIVYHGMYDSDPSKFNQIAVYKLLLMSVDLCLLKRGPHSGFLVLVSIKGSKFRHLTKISMTTVKKFFKYIKEAIPLRLKAIHVLNTEPIVDKILSLIRPFIDQKYLDMTKFHFQTENPEKLYEVIPRSSLPSNYGGTLPDSQTLHRQCMEELKLLEPYFMAEKAQRDAALTK